MACERVHTVELRVSNAECVRLESPIIPDDGQSQFSKRGVEEEGGWMLTVMVVELRSAV